MASSDKPKLSAKQLAAAQAARLTAKKRRRRQRHLRNWASLAIICALIGGYLALSDSSPQDFLDTETANNKNRYPQAILGNPRINQYNTDGSLRYHFQAEEMRHFQPNARRQTARDYTQITQPRLTIHQDQQAPWQLQAKQGHASAKGETLLLRERVIARQEGELGATSLHSSKLILKPDRQYAETDKPVIIRTPDSHTQAIGLQADLQRKKITLLSRVRSTHEP